MKLRLGLLFSLLCWGSLAYAAITPFTVKDIRLEGLQRVDPGTVFRNFPISTGDLISQYDLTRATRKLFGSGYFDDIELLRDGDVLVVKLKERPAVSLIRLDGNKVIKDKALKDGLKKSGLQEGDVFKRATLDRIQLDLQRLYVAQGRYGASVKTDVESLPGNRVALDIHIKEGQVATIQHINIVGNKVFSDDELKKLFKLQLPNMWSFITDSDRYSKEKLAGDLERLRSYYLDRGYINFAIDSTQVSISPDRKSVYITINVTEGDQYKVRDVDLAGNMTVPKAELESELEVKPGQIFSRKRMTDTQEKLVRTLGDNGYMFANVSPVPTPHDEDHTVSLRYFIEPGQRTYVRRILIKGNTTTADEVIRQQLTQMEAAVASADKIEKSKEKLSRTGYFKSVDVATHPVPGTNDQVDVEYTVQEQPSGQFTAAVGFSQTDGIILQLGVQQDNFFGTGKKVGFKISNSSTLTEYSFNYTDPYYTVDGVSRGFDAFYRKRNFDAQNVSNYTTNEYGGGINFGYPINDYQRLSFGAGVENVSLNVYDSTADEVKNFITQEGSDSYLDWLLKATWSDNHLDKALFPSDGYNQSLSLETAIPGSDLSYYRVQYRGDYYLPLNDTQTWVATAGGRLGYADSLGSNSYPFFKNYFAGGLSSVRGYQSSTLGPRDSNDDPMGGNIMTVGSLELIFPTPFLDDQTGWRTLAFLDAGNVFTTDCLGSKNCSEGFDPAEFRYSVGLGLSWLTPIGPLSVALAMPLNDKKGDKTELFQFSVGQTF